MMKKSDYDWKANGFLKNVPDKEKYATDVLNFTVDYLGENLGFVSDGLIFPVIIRILREYTPIKSEIIEIIKELSAEGCYDRSKYTCYSEIDCEAEFIGEYCENKLKQLKNIG
jgi:hypothetical protein